MSKKLLEELLVKIHHFYPIGFRNVYDTYNGSVELKSILEKKTVEQTIQQKGTWKLLSDRLSESMQPYKIIDRAYFQFPSYKLDIEISRTDENGISKYRSLVLVISLLTKHFTLYFEDRFEFNYLTSEVSLVKHPQYVVLYKACNSNVGEMELAEKVEGMVTSYFVGYTHAHHQLLFLAKVSGGVPYGEEYDYRDNSYSIYEFLFLNSPYTQPYTVLD